MSRVIVTKPGVLADGDKDALREHGIVPIEADDPSEIRFLTIEGEPLPANDMLFAALSGVVETDYGKRKFAEIVFKLVAAARDAQS